MKISNKVKNGVFNFFNYTIFGILAFLCIFPFYYVIVYSLSDPTLASQGLVLWPKGFTLINYETIFKLNDIFNALFVSIAKTLLGTGITIFCCSFFAYLVSHQNMRYRKFVYRFVVFTMYFNAGIIPWYLTMKGVGLKDNFLLYILPTAVVAYYIILIKTSIEQIPPALEESARIDGAGYVKCFFYIVAPVSKPIIATIALFAAVAQWSSWFDNFILISNHKLDTLQIILYRYLNSAQNLANMSALDLSRGAAAKAVTPFSIQVTITVVTVLPILIVYPMLQKYFVKGIMVGAVKG